jgi:hypothetical protein
MYTGRCQEDHSPLYWLVSQDEKWVLSTFDVVDYTVFASLFPFDEAKKLRNVPSPMRWTVSYAAPPGRMVLPDLPDANSGHFRIYNPYRRRYLGQSGKCNSWRWHWVTPPQRWVTTQINPPQGYWTQDPDVLIKELGDPFERTLVFDETATEFTTVFDSKGQPDDKKEPEQQNKYKQRCWLIQNRTPTAKKIFDELEHDYIAQWQKAHELTLQQAPPPT